MSSSILLTYRMCFWNIENCGFWFLGSENFHKVADLTILNTFVQVLPRSEWETHFHLSDPVDSSSTKMKLLTQIMCFWIIWSDWVKIVDFDFWGQKIITSASDKFNPMFVVCERRHHFIGNFGEEAHFIGYLREEAPFYWVNFGGVWCFYLFMSKTILEVGWGFILWSMPYLEGWPVAI